jgi:hypothetical protein
MVRFAIAALALVSLSGCVVAPAPYGYPGYGYAPGYVAAPPIVVGGGWGWGRGYGGGYGRRW